MPSTTSDPQGPLPRPPGGSSLRRQRRTVHRGASLPVVHETSAGGIAITIEDGVALAACIGRRNRAGKLEWCLPKGHIEGDETPAEAARREVAEETGIEAEVIHTIGVIDYWFTGDDRRVHKTVHHFLLEAQGGTITTENDPDQEAEVAAWIAVVDLPRRLAYPNERKVAIAAAELLAIS